MSASPAGAAGVFARAAASYNRVGPRHFTAFAHRLVAYTGVRAGDRVLDVGAGTGEALLAATVQSGPRGWAVGVDLAPAMLARAAAALRARGHPRRRRVERDGRRTPGSRRGRMRRRPVRLRPVLHPPSGAGPAENPARPSPGGRVGVVDTATWYFQQDPRWRWHAEALRAAGVLPAVGVPAADDCTTLAGTLRRAGFTAVRATRAAVDLSFRDEDEWWRWSWSHGSRRPFEAVPAGQLAGLKAELVRGLQGCREADGRFHGTMRAAIVRGQTPRGDEG